MATPLVKLTNAGGELVYPATGEEAIITKVTGVDQPLGQYLAFVNDQITTSEDTGKTATAITGGFGGFEINEPAEYTSLESRMTAAEASIESNSSSIKELENKLSQQSQQESKDIKALQSEQADLSSRISLLESQVAHVMTEDDINTIMADAS